MKLIIKLLFSSLLVFLVLTITLLVLVVEDKPKLRARPDITPEQIARGKQIFVENDPRRLATGTIARASIEQRDLDLAVNYFVNQYFGGVAGLTIKQDRAIIESTLKLPSNPLGNYLNLTIELKQTHSLPEIDHLSLGKLRIPGLIANNLSKSIYSLMLPDADWKALQAMIRKVRFINKRMIVTYKWHENLPTKLSGALLPEQEQHRIEVYQQRLVMLTRPSKKHLSLTELTQPLFQLANERSRRSDPIGENRAVILVLTLYANRLTLNKIIPSLKSQYRPIWRTVTLNQRNDLSKHYLVSATLAAYAGTPLADAIGLYKELEDSRGGSGFSFIDMTANRAGTLMGELAVQNQSQARKIQDFMSTAQERDIIPKTADLPEYLAEQEFNRLYGGLEGPAYQKMMQKIEHRIAQLPINKQ
ncbi:hypothetical protein [Methylotuvimicrobium buryatense]|uniref:Uncharacterized protein n=1 Tax=Methylotuvimicrobium buryatense TaxID=95641 RepID=A0A4P9UM31_METBY|nr:hypothetical protein [Methylotuvimicrobium buryatense]QCW82314.1 hypothetical protein EQU24_08725 [Methylotuvimicrobium buryatense]